MIVHRAAHGLALAVAARAQGIDDDFWWLTRAYFVVVHGGPGAADLDRRRRDARSSRRRGGTGGRAADVTAIVLLERGLGGAAHGHPRRGRLRRSRSALRRRRLPLARGRIRPRHDRAGLSLLRPLGAAAAHARAAAARRRSARAAAPRVLRGRARTSAATRGCSSASSCLTIAIQAVRILSIWAAAKAVGIDLWPADLLRHGPALLPRPARPVHPERDRGPRGVLRQLPRQLGVPADQAFASGFLFFLVTMALAVPGGVILLWEGVRGGGGRARVAWPCAAPRLRRRHLRRPAVDRAVPREHRRVRNGRHRQRLTRRHGRRSSGIGFPRCGRRRAENRGLAAGWNLGVAETRGEHVLILNADAWLVGDTAEQLLAAAATASARRRRRPAAPQHRRLAAAVGARLSDALAHRDGVPLPPQAGAAVAGAERLLRRWLRPRRGARRGVGDGLLHAHPARRARGGRAVRRALFPLQRGDGLDAPCGRARLVGRLLARGRVRPRRRRLPRWPALSGERPRPPALLAQHGRAGEAERARHLLRGSLPFAGGSTAASARGSTATWRPGSARATSTR